VIGPLLPDEPAKSKGGRPRIPDRAVLTGTVYVLKSGVPWRMLPKELGCGSGVTCWRRLRDWQETGVWRRLRRALLDRLKRAGLIGNRLLGSSAGSVKDSAICISSARLPGPHLPRYTNHYTNAARSLSPTITHNRERDI
jgi:transposase